MKYINFILLASLMSSFSVRAEEHNISKEIRAKAELAIAKAKVARKITGRMAKTAGYAALTSFYTTATILSTAALIPLWYQFSEGYAAEPLLREGRINWCKFDNEETSEAVFVTIGSSAVLVALAGGMAKLANDCAVKVKESAKEIKKA
jgi:hypothetical protein